MANGRFDAAAAMRQYGREAAAWDVANGYFGDVPANLTATYTRAPTIAAMTVYAAAYYDEARRLGISEDNIRRDRARTDSFIRAGGMSACEPRWFGRIDPDRN